MVFVPEEKTLESCVTEPLTLKQPRDVSDIIGSFGLWQKCIWLAVLYFEFMGAVANLSSPLLVPDVPYTCDVNHTYQEMLRREKRSFVIAEHSHCDVRLQSNGVDPLIVPCQKWIYNHRLYKYSFTEEWNLVCGNAWLLSFSNTVTILGDLIACSIFGYLSDRFGRRRTLTLLVFPVLAGTLVALFASNIKMFMLGRFLLGAAGHGGLIVSFVLLMETVGRKHRATVGISVKLGFTAGGVLMGLVAYCLRNSFQIQVALTTACFLLIPVTFLLPESPRWLLVCGQDDGITKAKEILRKAAKINGVKVSDLDEKIGTLTRNMLQEGQALKRNYGFLDLVRTPNLRQKTLTLTLLSGINAFCYYGITLISTRFGSDPIISFILIIAIEVPAYLLINPVAHFKGYKVGMLCGYILNSIVFITSSEAAIDTGWTAILAILLAKVGTITCATCLSNYATEIFPTVVRSLGLGTCAVVSRIFALLSPFLREMAAASSMSTVFSLLAMLSVTCSACVLFLPDTHRKPIPETLEDSEKTGLIRPWKTLHVSRKLSYFRVRRL